MDINILCKREMHSSGNEQKTIMPLFHESYTMKNKLLPIPVNQGSASHGT